VPSRSWQGRQSRIQGRCTKKNKGGRHLTHVFGSLNKIIQGRSGALVRVRVTVLIALAGPYAQPHVVHWTFLSSA